jgi:hypothetical protein
MLRRNRSHLVGYYAGIHGQAKNLREVLHFECQQAPDHCITYGDVLMSTQQTERGENSQSSRYRTHTSKAASVLSRWATL